MRSNNIARKRLPFAAIMPEPEGSAAKIVSIQYTCWIVNNHWWRFLSFRATSCKML